ncbi:hypothetical protein PF005_g17587 [Phytophthora fragariae]|uniref:Crinkler effector protein N-terminal domain-containing protein n=2 Tax=Phytophthora fragariae TaxID=53985 RepID=A0A6A3X3Y2_9STRA|nr:hypothetical protein PF003_g30849 [Phytophthora fragariae]KAE8931194.1 hypothetical protein PF009_g18737 [Phytophthora fragariae]KAE8995134.1 hypothetical protein PF011_g16452 [Phytophthora fragariae]KAE9095256.1 hypothetical protein PF007_g17440 [Phytophthora fragariae]KAE9126823.1 hypothetical protein PF006_g16641 [Phytophthora fragariae]
MDVKMTPPAATPPGEADVKMTPPTANEIKLYCGVYHRAKMFSVQARLDKEVDCLLVKLGKQLGAPSADLTLYLAKKKGGDWVQSDEELESFLARGPVKNESGGTAFNRMWPSNLLAKYFDQQTPPLGVVHVLVELPKKNLKRRKTDVEAPSALKDIQAIADIVGFTGSEFYVRKEVLCVLENFVNVYGEKLFEDKKAAFKAQFIFVDSPGTGKSCILALICFYLAIVSDVPVVWHRFVESEVEAPVTRMFHQGNYYEWPDRKGDIYSTIYDSRFGGGFDPASCWFCLDGLTQKQLADRCLTTSFTLLATSGQYYSKGQGSLEQVTCLLSFWREDDSEDLAKQMHMGNAADRYFVSGGSVRFFVKPVDISRKNVASALSRVSTDDADALLAHAGSGSQQIDSVRAIGIPNVTDPKQYTDPDYWKALVTSKMAMEYLFTLTKPDYFHKLFVTAKDVNDPQLQSLVLEQLFNSIAYNQNSVGISYMKYDNVDRRTHRDPEHRIMRKDMGSVQLVRSTESDKSLIINREGETLDEFAAVMERWAKNPDEMDYWIPASNTSETIDAVAKWEFKSETDDSGVDSTPVTAERFCLLQLSVANPMGEPHKCEASVVLRLAQPFLDAGKQVCYMALVCGGEEAKWDTHRSAEQKMVTRMEKFRLKPAVIEEDGRPPCFPLYVATYALL